MSNTARYGVDPAGAFAPARRAPRTPAQVALRILGALALCAGFLWGLAVLGSHR